MAEHGTIELPSALSRDQISLEACLALGAVSTIGRRAIPSLCAGHLVILDALESPFLEPAIGNLPNLEKTQQMVSVLRLGPESVQFVFEKISGEVGDVLGMAPDVTAENWTAVAAQFGATMQYAFGGLEAVDWGKDRGGKPVSDRFDMIWLSHIIAAAAESCPAETAHSITWTIPLAFVTHLAAATARQGGATIHRPYDLGAAFDKLTGK